MATTLYFHDATSADTGTLPSAALSAYAFTMSGAATNRGMDTTLTNVLTSGVTVVSVATISPQVGWFRRFISAPLAAQTVGDGATHWLLQGQGQSSSSSSAWNGEGCYAGIWRPSTGAVVGTFFNSNVSGSIICTTAVGTGTTQWGATGGSPGTSDLTQVTCANGDILVVEIGGQVTQGMATSYTWTYAYDWNNGTATAFIVCPTTLSFSTGPTAAAAPDILNIRQAVNRASTF